MPDLDTFEADVKANIKQLASKDAKTRRKAAAWLGEAGDPSAISALAQVYKHDPDPGVRETAQYSLGMFRALEQAFDNDEDRVLKLLEAVALEGKMGRRLPIRVRTMVRLEIVLLIVLIVLVVANVVLRDPNLRQSISQIVALPTAAPVTEVPVAADKDRETIVAELRNLYTLVSNNASKLQMQYQQVLGGGEIPCTEFFDALAPYTLSASNSRDWPELAAAAEQINTAVTNLGEAKAVYDRVCDKGENVPAADFGAPMRSVIALLESLPPIEQALNTAATLPTATVQPTTMATDMAAPTTDVSATPTPLNLRGHLAALQAIIDDMTGLRGANTRLNNYWQDNSASGCREQRPIIPDNYRLTAEEAEASPNLKLAVDLTNTGLEYVRQNWDRFISACQRGNPTREAGPGLKSVQDAQIAFDQAASLLLQLRTAP